MRGLTVVLLAHSVTVPVCTPVRTQQKSVNAAIGLWQISAGALVPSVGA
jgi:hypothetical protein